MPSVSEPVAPRRLRRHDAPLVVAPPSESEPARFSAGALIVALWGLGTAIALGALVLSLVRLTRATRTAAPIRRSQWDEALARASRTTGLQRPVVLRESPRADLLATWGWRRAYLLLPPEALDWSRTRIDVVLGHELAHVRRNDWAWQVYAAVIRALFWWNPLAWVAYHRLAIESERACDDAVLAQGIAAHAYAGHLVAMRAHSRWQPVAHHPRKGVPPEQCPDDGRVHLPGPVVPPHMGEFVAEHDVDARARPVERLGRQQQVRAAPPPCRKKVGAGTFAQHHGALQARSTRRPARASSHCGRRKGAAERVALMRRSSDSAKGAEGDGGADGPQRDNRQPSDSRPVRLAGQRQRCRVATTRDDRRDGFADRRHRLRCPERLRQGHAIAGRIAPSGTVSGAAQSVAASSACRSAGACPRRAA